MMRGFPFVLFLTCSLLSEFAAADYYRIEENSPAVTYTGSWTTYTGPTLSGGSLVTGGLGSTATVTFSGTGIHWFEYFSDDIRGGANVYIDGAPVDVVRARDCCVIDVWGEKQLRYSLSGLADTTHVLKIEGTGAPYSFSPLIAIDVFYVERGGVTRLIQESDTSVTYTGEWVEMDDPSVSGGSVMASRQAGATATVRFLGNAISWLSYACPCTAGIAHVGGTEMRSAYSTEYIPQATIFNDAYFGAPLTDDEHELKIEVTGTSAAQSTWVVIDAFRVQTGSTDGPDTTPPEIVIRHPMDGTIGNRVQLISDAFDNEGVNSLEYYVDGEKIAVDVTKPVTRLNLMYWWQTAGLNSSGEEVPTVSNGPHVLTAVARDSAGNETSSAPVTVNVSVTHTVTLIPPEQPVTGMATVRAVTTGEFNTALGVRFYARASDDAVTLLGTDTAAPYEITRDTSSIPDESTFSLWAETTDLEGNIVRTNGSWLVRIEH